MTRLQPWYAFVCSVAQLSLTLCNPTDYNPPESSVHGILQAIILDWVAISYCRGSSWPRIKPTSLASAGRFFTTYHLGSHAISCYNSENWPQENGNKPTLELKICVCVCMCVSHSVMSDSFRPHELQLARLICPQNSPGKNTGIGCHSLLQGIVPTQGLNLGLPHCRQILYHLSHQGSLELKIN